LATDDHFRKFPNQSPYNYPTYVVDLEGNDGIATVEGNQTPSNYGFFKEDQISGDSTTPAHEYAHNLGMDGHPDAEGEGCLVYYNEETKEKSGESGTTMMGTPTGATDVNRNVIDHNSRKVTQGDIDRLELADKLGSSNMLPVMLGGGGTPMLYNSDGSYSHKEGMTTPEFIDFNLNLIENGIDPETYWKENGIKGNPNYKEENNDGCSHQGCSH